MLLASDIRQLHSVEFIFRHRHIKLSGLLRFFSLTWDMALAARYLGLCWANLTLSDELPCWRSVLLAWRNPDFPGELREEIAASFNQDDWNRLWCTTTEWDELITDYTELEEEYEELYDELRNRASHN